MRFPDGATKPSLTKPLFSRVANGTRTRDHRYHKPATVRFRKLWQTQRPSDSIPKSQEAYQVGSLRIVRSTPDADDPVLVKYGIRTHDRHGLNEALSREESVEGITMVKRKSHLPFRKVQRDR